MLKYILNERDYMWYKISKGKEGETRITIYTWWGELKIKEFNNVNNLITFVY